MIKKSISLKLVLGFVTIVLISMLAIGLIFIQMFRQYTFESHKSTMLARAHEISTVMSEYSQGNGMMRGYGGFMRFLDTMAEAKVWITDSSGNPATITGMGGMGFGRGMGGHTQNSGPLPAESEAVIKEVLSGKESVSQNFSSVYNEATLTVGVPIIGTNNQVIGAVLLHAPINGITATLNKAIGILLISLLVSLIIAIGLGIFYSVQFSKPLKIMNSSALEMTKGNYAVRTGITREDELGQLSNSLDVLASELGNTINQLFQEKGKMSDIISSISEGIVAFDLNLNPLSVNSSLSQIMNRPTPYSNETVKDDFEKLEINQALMEVTKSKNSIFLTKDYNEKVLKFILSPIIDNNGVVTGCVALVQDISESEKLEQLRRDFVANISHEFRTPLTIIKGSLEALVDGTITDEEERLRFSNRMLSETRSLERLVNDLLELSRLQSGKISINIEKVNIPYLLTDTIKNMQLIADKKGIKINFNLPQDIPPFLGDYDRLRQLFVIFLDNAIKYSPADTNINVDVNCDEKLKVLIKDQGYGIPAEKLPFIWDRFYKVDKSRKSTGTGLGLAIAKHLVLLHGGEVSIDSEVGKGTEITLFLPIRK